MMLNISDRGTFLFILVASLWNIPMLYYLSTWVINYVLLVSECLGLLIISTILAQTSFWYLFHTYHYKISQVLIHLKPSGFRKLKMFLTALFRCFYRLVFYL